MMKTGLTATAIAALIMGAIAFWAIQAMPETGQIPIHWNHKGIADGFTTPEKARKFVWLLPGTGIFTGLVMAIALKIDPRRKNIERSSRAYLAVWIAMLAIMTIISALICYSMIFSGDASSGSVNNAIPLVIVGTSSLLFLILGNYLPKTRSNWFFGIRTPWTLSSEEAWIKTHRIAGRLFILAKRIRPDIIS